MQQYLKSPVMGQMMDQPLLISNIICHVDRYFGGVEVVSRLASGKLHRYTYKDCHRRARQLAQALVGLGVCMGDRVATLAWNGYRHLEAYFAIPGAGMVLHTINPRLHPDQIAYIAEHAEDQYLLFDLSFLPQAEVIAERCTAAKGFIALCSRSEMPGESKIANLICYEDLLDGVADGDFEWPIFDEYSAAGLCYTSGTTGNPKGALYSHRSTVVHSYAEVMPDAFNISSRDVLMPVVPMYHANAWGLPYAAALAGAKLVLPGAMMDGRSLYELIEAEQVTFSAGVPTVWLGVLAHMEENDRKFSGFRRMNIGGSACPPTMMRTFREVYDVEVIHAWGMTEMSPIGTICSLQSKHLSLSEPEQQAVRQTQGHPIFGVDLKLVDEHGQDVPWDGKTSGNLLVKGPWVIRSYFKSSSENTLQNGWFPTGDVATVNADGYMQIVDRSKDLIKSGGEWISSIDLENIALLHPSVQQAACIGLPHPKWGERPLLIVIRKEDSALSKEQLLQFYEDKAAKWWIPDDVRFIDSIELGPTGKVLKSKLRERFLIDAADESGPT